MCGCSRSSRAIGGSTGRWWQRCRRRIGAETVSELAPALIMKATRERQRAGGVTEA